MPAQGHHRDRQMMPDEVIELKTQLSPGLAEINNRNKRVYCSTPQYAAASERPTPSSHL
jgi:hypothetical protein